MNGGFFSRITDSSLTPRTLVFGLVLQRGVGELGGALLLLTMSCGQCWTAVRNWDNSYISWHLNISLELTLVGG